MVIKNRVGWGVEPALAHFSRNRVANGIRDTLAERPSGSLDTGGFVELRMAGGDAVKGAEIFHVFQGNSEAREVEPTVEEHAAVTGREDEAVAV